MRRVAASIPRDVLPAESMKLASLWNSAIAVSRSPVWRAERKLSITSLGPGLLVFWPPRRKAHIDERERNRCDCEVGDLKNKPARQLACGDGGSHESSLPGD